RFHPVIGRAGVPLAAGADESHLLDPRHVIGVGPVQVTVGPLGLVERDENPLLDRQLGERDALGLRTVAPVDPFRTGKLGHLLDPGCDERIGCREVRHVVDSPCLTLASKRAASLPCEARPGVAPAALAHSKGGAASYAASTYPLGLFPKTGQLRTS